MPDEPSEVWFCRAASCYVLRRLRRTEANRGWTLFLWEGVWNPENAGLTFYMICEEFKSMFKIGKVHTQGLGSEIRVSIGQEGDVRAVGRSLVGRAVAEKKRCVGREIPCAQHLKGSVGIGFRQGRSHSDDGIEKAFKTAGSDNLAHAVATVGVDAHAYA